MRVGFSLSPGGLLLPYHVGVLSSLAYYNQIDETSPIAGSSAGAIATLAHGCQIDPVHVLEATIQVSNDCDRLGGARGRLLPLLNHQLEQLVDDDAFDNLFQRPGITGIAYREVFPRQVNYLQTDFESKDDLFRAVSYSCSFPFFASNWPCAIDLTSPSSSSSSSSSSSFWKIPRLLVDGFFTVPRDRFGCPALESAFDLALDDGSDSSDSSDSSPTARTAAAFTTVDADTADTADTDTNTKTGTDATNTSTAQVVDRTVAISCFPKDRLKIHAFQSNDIICPSDDNTDLARLFRIATEASSRHELTQIYEEGWKDGEQWCLQQQQQHQQ